ncbi:MAG: CHASE2 domain-containing protein [Candidatus Omnitrophica bacterium]|nr:CHASE2 domain-containing protein [Candidatus Omnitrophota bacterium]
MKSLKNISLGSWIIIISFLVIFSVSYFRAFDNYELLFYDLRFRLRPSQKVSPKIVLIEISDDALKRLGTWPIPREFHAALVDVLKEYKAKSIVFDIIFSDRGALSLHDEYLSRSIQKAENVYLPLAFGINRAKTGGYKPLEAASIDAGVFKDFSDYAKGMGHINSPPDSDGKRRKVPLFIKYKDGLVPHLALKVACDFLGLNSNNAEFKKGILTIDKKLSLPVSSNASLLVNYPDVWEKSFKHLSFLSILQAYTDVQQGLRPAIDLSEIKDAICIIGLTASGTSDFKPTPLDNIYPMVGLQASVLNSILTQKFIREAPDFLNTLINISIFILCLFICLKFIPLKSFLGSLGLGLGYFILSFSAFIFCGLWTDLFFPLFIIVFTYAGSTLYRVIKEIRKRELIEKELEIAHKIQDSFLPQKIKECPGLNLACFFKPAKFVAGDLYDVVPLSENKMGVFIGDVSGKGVPASLIMAQTVSLFRVFATNLDNPAEVLTKLNTELSRVLKGRFVTALYLIIDMDSHLMTASCAGHSPIAFYDSKADEVIEFLPDSGPPLGVVGSLEYSSFERVLNDKDKFLLYTDGLTEARDKKGAEFELEPAKRLLFENRGSCAEVILNIIKDKLFQFSKGLSQHDDITLILLEVGAEKPAGDSVN